MDRTFDTAHRWALAATASLHALLAAWWWTVPERHAAAAGPDAALQVTWIERPTPRPPATLSPAAAPATPGPAAPPPASPQASTRRQPAPAPPATDPPTPLSAIVLEQASALARAGGGHDFRRNPLTDRPAAIAPPPPERIRMTEAVTPAKIAAGIGQLFGGPGYEANPCPRIRRNLGRLVTAGADSELLQEEVRRLQRFCQG